jgi:hypothetical protein
MERVFPLYTARDVAVLLSESPLLHVLNLFIICDCIELDSLMTMSLRLSIHLIQFLFCGVGRNYAETLFITYLYLYKTTFWHIRP